MEQVLPPVHPGEILREEFLVPLDLSVYRLAKELGVSRPTVNSLCRERHGVSPRMAALLGRFFGTTAEFWLNLQTQYDLRMLQEDPRIRDALDAVRPYHSGESAHPG